MQLLVEFTFLKKVGELKVSKISFIVAITLFFLMSRVAIDVIWSDSKPATVVGYYTVFGLLLSVFFLKQGKTNAKLIPLVIFLFPCTLFASQINSEVPLFVHIKFALTVFIPCLFLVSVTNVPGLMYQASLVYKKYLSFGVIFLLMIASYISYIQEAMPGESYYQHYLNTPNHVIAQSHLKASLPLITSGLLWVAIPFTLIFALNVRSVMLAYIMSLIVTHRNLLLMKNTFRKLIIWGLPLLILILVNVDWVEVYDRVVFKGRDAAHAGSVIDAASSGRLSIYKFYLTYIEENFGIKEWIAGVGPIWLQPGGPSLSAHNDVLNIFISFGLLGLISIISCYWYFYRMLSISGKLIFAISFSVLFITNGVVFHQSNVLFSLLYIFGYLERIPSQHR
ncbi:hypothetical protein CFI10_15780 [Marinobacterium iners]|uniref:O-antigen ligase family protein n=1 Tax=Marinobacterium iners TaxID=48076 RepID=UPI001A8D602E|nr:O-antigen ligase family protein [Marinobacterium iners]QSR36413.1 hypothetical protein CFI10_15780 [Marinobacterium iners]